MADLVTTYTILELTEVNGEAILTLSTSSTTLTLNVGGVNQIQSDWNESESTALDYIKNKPTIPTKTSDLTNDSGYIRSSSLTKENITGLKTTDSPEFTDVTMPAIAPVDDTGGQFPNALWSWIESIFPSVVKKSVLSSLLGLWTYLKSLAERVGLLEDKYILKYVVPSDSTSIALTTDKYGNAFNFVEGDEITFIIRVDNFIDGGNNRVQLRINGISASVYAMLSAMQNSLLLAGTTYCGHYSEVKFTIYNNEIIGRIAVNYKNTSGTYNGNSTYSFATVGLNVSSISTFNLLVSQAQYPIPAGTVILIKKK